MLCYLTDENLHFWAQAIALTIGDGDSELTFSVIASAVWTHGHSAYALFRDNSEKLEGSNSVLRYLDEVVSELSASTVPWG